MRTDYYEAYLAHYGVKGMRWGVRHDKPTSKRLTKAKSDLKEAKKITVRDLYSDNPHREQAIKLAKREVSNAKVELKLKNRTSKVGEREKALKKQYISQGLTASEAAEAAYTRAKMEKILAVTAGVAVGALGLYAGKRLYFRNVDQIIRAGKTIQNLATSGSKGVRDSFYGTYIRSDKNMYRGIFAKHLIKDQKAETVFNNAVRATSNIKIASDRSANKIVKNLIKTDSNYKAQLLHDLKAYKSYNNIFGATPKQAKVFEQAISDLSKGKTTKAVSDAQNILAGAQNLKSGQIYRSALKKAGYGGVRDINDVRYSGYGAKMSTIFFDKAKFVAEKSSTVPVKEINRRNAVDTGKRVATALVPNLALPGAVKVGMDTISSNSERRQVQEYRAEHPNTKKSSYEILKMLNDKENGKR